MKRKMKENKKRKLNDLISFENYYFTTNKLLL